MENDTPDPEAAQQIAAIAQRFRVPLYSVVTF
jgi:hypothetical protein